MNKPADSISNFDNININSFHPIIEIHVSCKDLIKLDIGSESDPMCVLFTKENGNFIESQRTETIFNDPNPNFVKSFKVYYMFESNQPLRFDVYDVDSEKASLKNHDFIGYAETDVQYLVSNLDQELTFELKNDKKNNKRGQIILISHQTKESNTHLQGTIEVEKLKKMKTFSKNNPFYEISKPSESGRYIPIYRSEIRKKCYSCQFKTFAIPVHHLITSSLDDPIRVTFFDHKNNKTPKIIGKCEMSVRQFMETIQTKQELLNENKNVGFLKFLKLEVVQIPTFLDYLKSGLQLNMITAIDFTGSNGSPKSPYSLHYITNDNGQLNQYQQSIFSVGSVLTKYDSDQKFAVYGFGAKIGKKVSMCFPLTFDDDNVEVDGLDGILNVYKESIQKVELYGPTYFAPAIRQATEIAIQSFNESRTYTILLILTDGAINDMDDTIDAIVYASDKPLSIIIIGVGNADFSAMDILDADEKPLKSRKKEIMKRDIVQFVPFNKFKKCSIERLENEVLAEVPRQVHEYCSTHGFIPKLPESEFI